MHFIKVDIEQEKLAKIRSIVYKKHTHCAGMNECAICDQSLEDAILSFLKEMKAEHKRETALYRETLLKVAGFATRDDFPGPMAEKALASTGHHPFPLAAKAMGLEKDE